MICIPILELFGVGVHDGVDLQTPRGGGGEGKDVEAMILSRRGAAGTRPTMIRYNAQIVSGTNIFFLVHLFAPTLQLSFAQTVMSTG